MIDFDRLASPFEPNKVSWRIGSVSEKDGKSRGMALAYIDARDVMERLDDVVGPGGWQNDYPHAGSKTVCRIGILINDTWVWKSDGAGDTDVEAEKGSLSDAFKRAAVRWGIGRYLYEIAAPWVELEGSGKFKKIASHEHAKLERLLKNYRPAQRAVAAPTTPPMLSGPQPMSVDHMLHEIAACSGSSDLDELKQNPAFREGYRAADEVSRKRIQQAIAAAEQECAA